MVQDAGIAVKKSARRVTDPARDARPKRSSKGSAAGTAAGTAPSVPERPKGADRPQDRDRPKEVGGPKGADQPKRRRRAGPKRRRRLPRLSRRRARAGEARRRRVRGDRKARRRRRRRRLPRPSGAKVAAAITRFGERASRLILGALAPFAAVLVGVATLARRALAALAAAVTPLRATLAVTALAAILLGISQFVDYRGVSVGVPEYSAYADAESVAPAPQVGRETAGSAHGYALLPVAVAALGLLFLCARGRWQLGRVVALLGLAAIGAAVIVDVPAGLDDSAQAIAYEGVEAQLIEGFYVQVFAAAVLVAGGLLVSHHARRAAKRPSRRRRRRATPVGPARASAA